MIINLKNFINVFACISIFLLPIQALFVFVFKLPSFFQILYPFILIGIILCFFIPRKYILASIDKNFVFLFLLLLLSFLISYIINIDEVTSHRMNFTYYTNIYSNFWDRPDIRMFNWGILRPTLFFIYSCILLILLNLKGGIRLVLKTLVFLALITSIYSIYQVIAAFFHLPFGALFSGHSGNEIFLFGNLRRVEGIFYEPGPQATFLSPILCIMFSQLFEKAPYKRLFSKKWTIINFLLILIVSILTFSPIAFLTILILPIMWMLINYKDIKLKITKKTIKYFCIAFIFIIFLVISVAILIKRTSGTDFSIVKYMIEKIAVSTTSFDSPLVYLNPDSRSVRAYVGMELFKDHPIFGAGPGSSITYFFKYANFTSPRYILRDQTAVINTHIKMLCEFGLSGFFIYLIILLYPIYCYIKRINVKNTNRNLINSLLIGYLIYITISFQSTFQIWMPYFWMIYTLLLISTNRQKYYIVTNIKN